MVDVTGLIAGGASAAVAFAVGIFKTIAVDEFKAWTPRLSDLLMHSAVRRLPPEQQERYAEEWKSAIADIPGWIGKLIFALDLHRASFGMHRILAKLHTAPKDPRVPFALYIFAVNKSVRIVLKVALASTKVSMTIEDIQIIARRILSGRNKD